MSDAEPIESELTKPIRFRIRPLYLFFVLSVCLVAVVYWWSSLTNGPELHLYKRLSIRLNVSYDAGVSPSESEGHLNVTAGKLKSIIENRLKSEGFEVRWPKSGGQTDLFVGNYRGSPSIELQLSWIEGFRDEGGIYDEVYVNFRCQLPRSTLRYQEEMTMLIKEFEDELETWLDDCSTELRNGLTESQMVEVW